MKKVFSILLIIMLLSFGNYSVNAIDDSEVLETNKVTCGNVTAIPKKIPKITSDIVTVIEIAIPVILVIIGSIDLAKGIIAAKDDEIKKGQRIFIKRLITGALAFFIIVIVKFIISIVADNVTSANISKCISCFIDNNCEKYIPIETPVETPSTETPSISYPKANIPTIKPPSTDTPSTESQSTQNPASSALISSSTIFVGDSRTNGMCNECSLCEGNDNVAEDGKGYDWFEKTAVSQVNNKIKSKTYNIVILMGVNGVGSKSEEGTAHAKKYYDKVLSLAKNEWKNQNIVYVSINPVVDGKSYAYTAAVNSFNSSMKKSIESSGISNLKYCDTNTTLKMYNDIFLLDGLHYTCTGYGRIYSLIKENCLK